MHNLTGPNSPRETPKIHFIILNWGLLPRLTTEVEPQAPYIIMASRKEGNTSPMGLQQHAMIIYESGTPILAYKCIEMSYGSSFWYILKCRRTLTTSSLV